MTNKQLLENANVELRVKDSNWAMRLIGKVSPSFLSRSWTTIILPGHRVIYYPTSMSLGSAQARTETIHHELKHVEQADTLLKFKWLRWPSNLLFYTCYIFLPLPVLFSYFRWRWERQAYMVSIAKLRERHIGYTDPETTKKWVEQTVNSLWKGYFFAWPEGSMRKWFYKQLELS